MRKRNLGGLAILVAAVGFTGIGLAQTTERERSDAAKPGAKATQPFDPHDFAGIWDAAPSMQPKDEFHPMGNGATPPFTPAGKAKFDSNVKFIASGAVLDCDPLGVSRSLFSPRAFQVFPSQGVLIQHFEYYDGWREIWTDGRKPPEDPDPAYWGYSNATWDGNTLVVDVIGFNGKAYLSSKGLPMSDAMHQTERWQRVDHDTLKIAVTLDDPKMYTKPWTATYFYKLKSDWKLDRDPCIMSANREWDLKMGHVDGLPGAEYNGEKPNR
jgi:hypothetical protein